MVLRVKYERKGSVPAVKGVAPVERTTNLSREIVTKGDTRNNSGTLRSSIPAILGSLIRVFVFFLLFLVFLFLINFVNFSVIKNGD